MISPESNHKYHIFKIVSKCLDFFIQFPFLFELAFFLIKEIQWPSFKPQEKNIQLFFISSKKFLLKNISPIPLSRIFPSPKMAQLPSIDENAFNASFN